MTGRTNVPLRRRPHGALRIVGGPAAGGGGGACTLVRTYLGSYEDPHTVNGVYSANFDCGTVTSGDLLVVSAAATQGQSPNHSANQFQVTKNSGTATMASAVQVMEAYQANDFYAHVAVFYVKVTGSGTLVLHVAHTGETYGPGGFVIKYTNHDDTTPVVTGVTDIDTDGVANFSPTTATLANTPLANDEVLIFVDADADAASGKDWTPGTGFSELGELTSSSSFLDAEVSVRTGSTSTTIEWPTSDNNPHQYTKAGVAVIVKAGTNCGAVTVLPRQRRYPFVAISSKVARA